MKMLLADQTRITLVDDADYAWLKEYSWYAHICKRHMYVARPNPEGLPRTVLMHRAIMMPELVARGEQHVIDHINHDTLDNRRCNLRLATRSENNANARRFGEGGIKSKRGYSFKKGKYEASLKFAGNYVYLGRFVNERDAAEAYNTRATLLWGELATLNDLRVFDVEDSRLDQEEENDAKTSPESTSSGPPINSSPNS